MTLKKTMKIPHSLAPPILGEMTEEKVIRVCGLSADAVITAEK